MQNGPSQLCCLHTMSENFQELMFELLDHEEGGYDVNYQGKGILLCDPFPDQNDNYFPTIRQEQVQHGVVLVRVVCEP